MEGNLDGWLRPVEQGSGRVERVPSGVRLIRSSARSGEYSNAQLGDPPGALRWRPPLTLEVRARFSHPVSRLRGTAGFGFWNAALAPNLRSLRLPRAAWFFFGGPPHDVPLAYRVPGHGFKAATLDARRLPFLLLLPAAPLGFLLMRVPPVYRRLWPVAQRAIGAAEAALDRLDLTVARTYTIRWEPQRVTFAVDGEPVLVTPAAPRGPLAFVAWIDNAYAIATPQGRFALGTIDEPEPQWLELERVELDGGMG